MSPTGSAPRGRAVHGVLGAPPRPAPPPLDRPGAHGPRSRSGRGVARPRSTPMREGSGGSRAPLRRVPPLPFLGAEHRVQAPLVEKTICTRKPEEIANEEYALFVPKRDRFDSKKSTTNSVTGESNEAVDKKKNKREELKEKLQVVCKGIKDVLGDKVEKIQCFAELLVLFCRYSVLQSFEELEMLFVEESSIAEGKNDEWLRELATSNTICCADESYVCFARDDEDKLLIYGFETVETEDTWEHLLACFMDFKAVLFVPKRDPFDLFDNIKLELGTFFVEESSIAEGETNEWLRELATSNTICCADESYVCFARDDEDKLLTYGFETVQILKVIDKCIELFFQIAENKEDYNNPTRPSPRT